MDTTTLNHKLMDKAHGQAPGIRYYHQPADKVQRWMGNNKDTLSAIVALARSKHVADDPNADWSDFTFEEDVLKDTPRAIVYGMQQPDNNVCSFCTLDYSGSFKFLGSTLATRCVFIGCMVSTSRADATGRGIIHFAEKLIGREFRGTVPVLRIVPVPYGTGTGTGMVQRKCEFYISTSFADVT
eukprot:COSAG02_NODE_5552_length_4235_cov_26.249275_1_plen_184_part_00